LATFVFFSAFVKLQSNLKSQQNVKSIQELHRIPQKYLQLLWFVDVFEYYC